MSGLLVAVLLF